MLAPLLPSSATEAGERGRLSGKVRRYFPLRCETSDYLIKRVLDDADGAGFEQLGKELAYGYFVDYRIDRKPFFAFQMGCRIERCNGRCGDRRQQPDHSIEAVTRHVHLDAYAAFCVQRAF